MDVILIFIIILIITVPVAVGGLKFAPWVPMLGKDLERINKLAALKPGQVFYDLGSGDGKVVIGMARRNPESKCVGVEIAWPLWLWARVRNRFFGKRNASFERRDFYKVDLSRADVVYFFGTPEGINNKFIALLKKQLKPGTKVISYAFRVGDWEPKIHDKPDKRTMGIYVYEVEGLEC